MPTTSEVDYGTTTHYLANAVDSSLTTNHYVVLDPSNLLANTTFHFIVKGADASHHLIASPDQTFKTWVAAPASKHSWSLTSWLAAGLAGVLLLGSLAVLILNLLKNRRRHNGNSASGSLHPGGGSGQIITPLSGGGPTLISPMVSSAAAEFETEDSGYDSVEPPATSAGPDISI